MHNQLDHSGVDFEGVRLSCCPCNANPRRPQDLPWMPTTKYHDDHHRYFHCNFGLHLITWDWLGGTLRSRDRMYGEDNFVGHQDATKAQAAKEE
jgi:sterol desaturase/sphingolipid hydroxylase (fatty acid hydroxylase superfamily)